jgi:hypothetical protein
VDLIELSVFITFSPPEKISMANPGNWGSSQHGGQTLTRVFAPGAEERDLLTIVAAQERPRTA